MLRVVLRCSAVSGFRFWYRQRWSFALFALLLMMHVFDAPPPHYTATHVRLPCQRCGIVDAACTKTSGLRWLVWLQ